MFIQCLLYMGDGVLVQFKGKNFYVAPCYRVENLK